MKKIILTAACALIATQAHAQEKDFIGHMTFGTSFATSSGFSFQPAADLPYVFSNSFYFDEGFMLAEKLGESNFATLKGLGFSITYIGLDSKVLALGEEIGQSDGSYLIDARSTSKQSAIGKFSLEMPLGLAWYHKDNRTLSLGCYGAWHVMAMSQEMYDPSDGGWRVTETTQGRLNTSRFGVGLFAEVRMNKSASLYARSEFTPFFRQRVDLVTPMFTSNSLGVRLSMGD